MKPRFLCSILPGSIALLIFAQSAHAATVFWSGGGADANAGTSGNWFDNGFGQFQPNPGDAIIFNNTTGSNFTINMNYGINSFFDSMKSFTGAGAITLTGDRTFLYVFENNNNASLLKATADLSNRTGPDSELFLNALGSGGVEVTNVIMQNGRQLIFNGPNTITVGGIISQTGVGNATTSIIGGATVIYKGANSYSGDTFVNSGKLQFATGGSANNSVIRIGDTSGSVSATVELTPLTGGLTLSSVMGARSGSSGTATIASLNTSGSNTLSNQIYLDKALAITQAAGGTLNITQVKGVDNTTGTDIKGQTLTLTAAAGGTINHSGTIYNSTGNGTLTANGAGTVILSGINTYTGDTFVQNGTLVLRGGADNRLASTAKVSLGIGALGVGTSGILQLGDSAGASNQTLTSLTRIGTTSANGVVGGHTTVSTLTINSNTSFTFDGTIGGAAANQNNLALTKTGTGILTLSGSGSYVGPTLIRNGGIAVVAGNDRIGVTSAVTLGDSTANTSGLLVLGNTGSARSQTVSSLTTVGSGTDNRVVGGHATNSSTLTINNSTTETYAGFLGGAGANQNNLSLNKTGAGTLVLTQANTYAGTTTVNAGSVLRAANNSAFGTSAVTLQATTGFGTTLELANGITINRGLTISNAGDNKTIRLQDGATSGEYSGAITISENLGSEFDLLAFAGGTLTVSGQIGASAGANINKEGAGTVVVSGNNTSFDKSVTINAGVLRAGHSNAFGSTGGITLANTDTALELANGVTISRGLTINQLGDKKTLALQDGATAAEYSGGILIKESTNGNVEVSVGNAGTLTISGAVTSEQAAGLTKTGAGTLILSSASNTYTGNTTISGGKLLITESIGTSTAIVSASGAILATDTAATIGSTLAVNNGAILAVGDAANATTATATVVGATTFNNGSIFSWDINAAGTSYDKLVTTSVLGQASPAGDAIFRIVVADTAFANAFWTTDRTWADIFTTDGSAAIANWATVFGNTVSVVNSSFASITPSAGTFSITGSSLNWIAVPEPSSALAGLLIGAGLLRRRRA